MKVQRSFVFLTLVVIAAVASMAFAPLPAVHAQEGGALTEAQLVIVGLVASALTWVLKLAVSRGWRPTREAIAIGLYVVSFFTAILFTSLAFPAYPPFTDAPTFIAALFTYIGLLLQLASPIAGIAYLIYNVLLKRVLDGMFPGVRGNA